MNQLEQLRRHTTVVADTGDFRLMQQYQPQDATTNPSLVLKLVQKPEYQTWLQEALAHAPRSRGLDAAVDQLLVRIGCAILKIIPGRVSTELDARASFDSAACIARARRIMALYQDAGVGRERVLIKIAATWQGLQAAQVLEQEGIHSNLTLLFNSTQAIAAGQAKAQLISPFVGRIYDWHKARAGATWNEAAFAHSNDPGVRSVRNIWCYYKQHDIRTEVMGASFRNVGQILALAGCDLLTISPELLQQLQDSEEPAPAQLTRALWQNDAQPKRSLDEATFHTEMADDAMASEKLQSGIAAFIADTEKLEALLQAHT